MSAYARIRQHTAAYGSIRQHTDAAQLTLVDKSHFSYGSIRQHTAAYVSIRQNMDAAHLMLVDESHFPLSRARACYFSVLKEQQPCCHHLALRYLSICQHKSA